MTAVRGGRAKWVVLVLWLLVAILYFYMAYDYIRIRTNDDKFAEYLQYVVQLAATENRPAKDVRSLLLVKADELSLPMAGNQISIKGFGKTLNVSIEYEVGVDLPVFQHAFYVKKFQHKAKFTPVR